MTLNGTAGARLHINFPVIARSSFGFWFSYFAVGSRIVLAMFWLSILAYIGSQCLYQVTFLYSQVLGQCSFVHADAESDLACHRHHPESPST